MFDVIFTPIVTEKSTLQSQLGQYLFYVPERANKIEVKKEIERLYGKKVMKVTVIKTPAKTRIVGRGRVFTKRKPQKKVAVTFKDHEKVDLSKTK